MKTLAIVFGSIILVACTFGRVRAEDSRSEVAKAQLASMGLAGLWPMSDAAGNQVRGNCAIFGDAGAIGIPLDSVGKSRLVFPLAWPYHKGFPDLTAVILRHLLEADKGAEPIPPGHREF